MKSYEEIIGIIIVVIIPILCNNRVSNHACTSCYCVKSDKRGKGLGITLMKTLMNYGLGIDILSGYHILPIKRGNVPKVDQWVLNIKTDNTFKEGPFKSDKVTMNNIEEVYDYLINFKLGNFNYRPTIEEFKQWCNVYDTFIYRINKQIIGLWSFAISNTIIKNTTIQTCLLNFSMFDIQYVYECMISAILESVKTKSTILYGYYIGSLASERNKLSKLKLSDQNIELYFGIYNYDVNLSPKDIYTPIF